MSSKKNQALASASSRVEPDDTTHCSTSSSCASYEHSRMTHIMTDDITMVTTITSIIIIISITNLTITSTIESYFTAKIQNKTNVQI